MASWLSLTIRAQYSRHKTTDRATSFKLFGLHIDSSLSWFTHIDSVNKMTTTRLYFLKQLKTARLSSSHLLHLHVHNSHKTGT